MDDACASIEPSIEIFMPYMPQSEISKKISLAINPNKNYIKPPKFPILLPRPPPFPSPFPSAFQPSKPKLNIRPKTTTNIRNNPKIPNRRLIKI